jgi:hypothetical protein
MIWEDVAIDENGRSDDKEGQSERIRSQEGLLQLPVLGFGLLRDWMSGSAFFHRAERVSLLRFLQENHIRFRVFAQQSQMLAIRRPVKRVN